ncbi:MAG: Spo0E family sporulation regulatory protein-aspartic acid phosphatase [Clostridia bacterium]
MLAEKIENLKELLNSMVGSDDYTYTEILEVSQELDVLIVRYYRRD